MTPQKRALIIFGGVVIVALVTLFTAFLAVLSSGAGHGNYFYARLFFPFTMLLTKLTDNSITTPLIILALAQFPIYAVLIGVNAAKPARAKKIALVLLVLHGIAIAFCFSGVIPNFS